LLYRGAAADIWEKSYGEPNESDSTEARA